MSGKAAFDYIADYAEWTSSGHFTEEINAILKGACACVCELYGFGCESGVFMCLLHKAS